jgi:sugar lactone lactonase YvrE
VDSNHSRILKLTPTGATYAQSVLLDSDLNAPRGVAIDGSGNIYIADTYNNRVVKETLSSGDTIERSVGSGFLLPEGVAVDGHGNVYVADYENRRTVKETLTNGVYTRSFVGTGTRFPGGQDED